MRGMLTKTYCFDKAVLYREVTVKDNPVLAAFFEFYNPEKKPIIVIPDGALDLLFLYKQRKPAVYLGGTALKGRKRLVPIEGRAFGVRMRPGVVLDCFRSALKQLVDSAICLNDVAPFTLMLEKIAATEDFGTQINIFNAMFPTWDDLQLHPITKFLLQRLERFQEEDSLEKIIKETGYSHVHVTRVFKQQTGLSLKFFLDTLRMQKAIYLLEHGKVASLEECSLDLGFYDQAHFTKSFKQYTCYSPKQFYNAFCLTKT